jgi:hypothetical protein
MKNSVASALAAGCSKLILAPFDTIKTLQQHSRSASTATATAAATSGLTLLQAAKTIAGRPKGILEFYVRFRFLDCPIGSDRIGSCGQQTPIAD